MTIELTVDEVREIATELTASDAAITMFINIVGAKVDACLESTYDADTAKAIKIYTVAYFAEKSTSNKGAVTSQKWADGMVGYYFAYLANYTNGQFTSVDIDPNIESNVYDAYKNLDPNLKINHITGDSLSLLKNPPYIPNLVHLDSWDVNLKDPLPSALHGWREFEAIESIMPIGSIIIIDDNWYKGMWVQWNTHKGHKIVGSQKLDINYPCLGKGAHIYQYLLPGDKNWKILDASYKLTIQKQW